ncbi:MAG: type II secretion system protein [Alphaproteobacteria bacterium]|nr:type II secretion system protein [Alphaproteobacteria bacterium]
MTIRCGGFGSELGRSMIEMLGVLAIVGVLSIGGISAFQKAMNKHKINQVTEELSLFINELLRYSADWQRMLVNNGATIMTLSSELDYFVPAKWKRVGTMVYDGMGNRIAVRLHKQVVGRRPMLGIIYVFYLSGVDKAKVDLCMACFDRIRSYADSLGGMMTWRRVSDKPGKGLWVYGNAYCDGKTKKCLKDLTLKEMREMCSIFQGDDDDKVNSFEIYFPL